MYIHSIDTFHCCIASDLLALIILTLLVGLLPCYLICYRIPTLLYSCAIYIKCSVQRKLRWVENGVDRRVGASDCSAGHSFVVLFGFHLAFAIFPFPVSTAQIIGEFWKNK
jgi:hypothetical protein